MRLTIRDLERESGLPRRTIHFYAHEGLLPPPEGAGPSATYGEEHLLRLRLIPRLKLAGLRLDRIACALDGLSMQQMRRLLQDAPAAGLEDPCRMAVWLGAAANGAPHAADGHASGEVAPANGPVTWRRLELAPGVEIHYRPGEDSREIKVRRLLQLADELFGQVARSARRR